MSVSVTHKHTHILISGRDHRLVLLFCPYNVCETCSIQLQPPSVRYQCRRARGRFPPMVMLAIDLASFARVEVPWYYMEVLRHTHGSARAHAVSRHFHAKRCTHSSVDSVVHTLDASRNGLQHWNVSHWIACIFMETYARSFSLSLSASADGNGFLLLKHIQRMSSNAWFVCAFASCRIFRGRVFSHDIYDDKQSGQHFCLVQCTMLYSILFSLGFGKYRRSFF